MTSGLGNEEKSQVRRDFAEGKIDRAELMKAEMASYHGPGTCTFYGTANSNQMLMEFMGLHLPGASFINPGTPLRDALTDAADRSGDENHCAWQRLYAGLRRAGRTRLCERSGGPDGDGRVDQSGAASDRHGARLGRAADLCRFRCRVGRHAAHGAGLSERSGRREPFPCRRGPAVHDRSASGGWLAARGCADGRRARACRPMRPNRS